MANDAVAKYLATIGSKGGAAGRGAAKRRTTAHYRKAALAMHAKRKAKAKQ